MRPTPECLMAELHMLDLCLMSDLTFNIFITSTKEVVFLVEFVCLHVILSLNTSLKES